MNLGKTTGVAEIISQFLFNILVGVSFLFFKLEINIPLRLA